MYRSTAPSLSSMFSSTSRGNTSPLTIVPPGEPGSRVGAHSTSGESEMHTKSLESSIIITEG